MTNDPFKLHKVDGKKFLKIINSSDTNSNENISLKKHLIIKKFKTRIGDWKKLLSNVETADHRKAFEYAVEWLRFIGYKDGALKTFRDFSVSLPEAINISMNNETILPYSVIISFYKKLSKVFEVANLWETITPLVLDLVESVYFYETEMVFDYKHEPCDYNPINLRIRPYERIENYRHERDINKILKNLKLYPIKEINLIDRYLISVSESMFYALGGYDILDSFEIYSGIDSQKLVEGFNLIVQAIDAGLSSIKFGPGLASIICIPKAQLDSNGRLHNPNGPAVQFDPDHKEYYYHGVRVDERIIMHPEELTIEEIKNTEFLLKKEAMIAKYGLERFIENSQYKILDSLQVKNNRYELLSIDINAQQDLRAIKVVCPSTRKTHYIRVSPGLDGFDEALAWTFGLRTKDILFYEET